MLITDITNLQQGHNMALTKAQKLRERALKLAILWARESGMVGYNADEIAGVAERFKEFLERGE